MIFFLLFCVFDVVEQFLDVLRAPRTQTWYIKSSKIVILWLYLQETRVYLHSVSSSGLPLTPVDPRPPRLWTSFSLVWQFFSDAPTAFSFDFIMMSYLSSPSGRILWRVIQQLFGCSVVSGTSVLFFSWYFSPFHSLWQNDNIGIKLSLLRYSYTTTNWLSACPQQPPV